MKKVKLLSFCLAALLLFYAIPMNIYAEVLAVEETAEETAGAAGNV